MPTIETYYHNGILFTWHHEPQNEYNQRHISLYDCVQALEDDRCVVVVQDEYEPVRWKAIGLSPVGIITVITEEDEAIIVTAWHSSAEEVKEWLSHQ